MKLKLFLIVLIAFLCMGFVCQQCQEEGKESKVFFLGCSAVYRPNMDASCFWDEQGDLYCLGKVSSCTYRCSNGHKITDNGTSYLP